MISSTLNYQWIIALTEDAIQVKADKRMNKLNKRAPNTSLASLQIPSEEIGDDRYQYVGWDQGKVFKASDSRPYSTQFGPCLAILGRAFQKNESSVSYLSFNHIFMNPQVFSKTLQELAEKIQGIGKIELFCSGGESSSTSKIAEIRTAIEILKKNYPQVDLSVKDETYRIADLGTCLLTLKDNKSIYPTGSCGLAFAGFDQYFNPFQVIGFLAEPKDAIKNIESSFWASV
jgi:hypothetical protein